MKWIRFRIKTTTEAEDIIISELYDAGFEGAQIEDKVQLSPLEKEQMFVDILPDVPDDDGVAFLNFFVEIPEGSADVEALKSEKLSLIKEMIEEVRGWDVEVGEGSVEVSETEDIDWINNWKKYFHHFTIDDIFVIPSWEEEQVQIPEGMKVLHIDPGTAFGTGMHDTTQLCIRNLRKYITPETQLLDVGTGSGILSILSLMCGAKHAVGTDLDPCAVPAVADNSERNGINPADFELIIGNVITDEDIRQKVGYGKYDIVVANILAEVLVGLTPQVPKFLKQGGIYITSGILIEKEDLVKKAMTDAGLEVLDVSEQGEWSGITARKN